MLCCAGYGCKRRFQAQTKRQAVVHSVKTQRNATIIIMLQAPPCPSSAPLAFSVSHLAVPVPVARLGPLSLRTFHPSQRVFPFSSFHASTPEGGDASSTRSLSRSRPSPLACSRKSPRPKGSRWLWVWWRPCPWASTLVLFSVLQARDTASRPISKQGRRRRWPTAGSRFRTQPKDSTRPRQTQSWAGS